MHLKNRHEKKNNRKVYQSRTSIYEGRSSKNAKKNHQHGIQCLSERRNPRLRHAYDNFWFCPQQGRDGKDGKPGLTGMEGSRGDTGVRGSEGIAGISGPRVSSFSIKKKIKLDPSLLVSFLEIFTYISSSRPSVLIERYGVEPKSPQGFVVMMST